MGKFGNDNFGGHTNFDPQNPARIARAHSHGEMSEDLSDDTQPRVDVDLEFLNQEVVDSSSVNLHLHESDVHFFQAPTTLSSPTGAMHSLRQLPERKSERSAPSPIRVKRAGTTPPRNKAFLSERKTRSQLIDGAQADPKLSEGSRLGNYEIIRKIGKGGMGVVYEGRHLLLPRKVAIKFLLTHHGHDEEQVRRFLGEAVAAAQIGHKGVVDIYDYGHTDSNRAYLVMEYVEGQSLQSVLKKQGALPTQMALRIVRDIAEVLDAAHTNGIVHRDLKPDNILLARDELGKDYLKILDFGVAKFVNSQAASQRTQAGSILGTPWYMPPEQCQGLGTVDARSDIYALGCVFYQMLCGKVPFAGSLRDVLMGHIHNNPMPPRQFAPSLPPQVEELLLSMLAKSPLHRPESMASLMSKLDSFIASHTSSTEPITPGLDSHSSNNSISPLQLAGIVLATAALGAAIGKFLL